MVMTHETKSAKSGRKPRDQFDPARPFAVLEGVGRLQRHGVVYALFDLIDDHKTFDFVTVFGESPDGAKYIVGDLKFDGSGRNIGTPSNVPVDPPSAPDPAPVVAEVDPEVVVVPDVGTEPELGDATPSTDDLGI